MNFRNDIQMLRGIAVILVVGFHFGVPGFASGFLGVDVFFVISGYLMATLFDPARTADFFARRARRLLPAYFATIVATLLAAVFVVAPNDFRQVSSQALFASGFASNIGFWMENSYFDKATFKPLLHLWSLGVDIQFYLLVPAIHWAFRRTKYAYPATLLASAALCFVVVGVSPKTSFFWLPTRLWEFLVGFGVACHLYRGPRQDGGTWIGLAAMAAILAMPLIAVDGQAPGFLRGHPGAASLLVCLATGAALAFGIPRRLEDNRAARALQSVGGYSYSIYLAHFPVMVLFLYRPFSGTVLKAPDPAREAVLLLLVATASLVLFRLVEQPGRKLLRTPWRAVLLSFVAVLAIGQAGFKLQEALTPAGEMLVYRAWEDRSEYRCGKLDRVLHPRAVSCEITGPLENPSRRVLLVGNSHADAIKDSFKGAALARRVAVFFMVENNPLIEGGLEPAALIEEARRRRADAIVLHYSPGSIAPEVVGRLAELAAGAGLRVSFIMPVPAWGRDVPTALLDKLRTSAALPSQGIDDYRAANRHLADGLAAIDVPGFKVYQTAAVFCGADGDGGACRLAAPGGKPLYFDSHHLTLTGSELLRGVFDRVVADLP